MSICPARETTKISRSAFHNCRIATGNGGAISVTNQETNVIIEKSSFRECSSEKYGGALYADIQESSIELSLFHVCQCFWGFSFYICGLSTSRAHCNAVYQCTGTLCQVYSSIPVINFVFNNVSKGTNIGSACIGDFYATTSSTIMFNVFNDLAAGANVAFTSQAKACVYKTVFSKLVYTDMLYRIDGETVVDNCRFIEIKTQYPLIGHNTEIKYAYEVTNCLFDVYPQTSFSGTFNLQTNIKMQKAQLTCSMSAFHISNMKRHKTLAISFLSLT